MTPQLIDRKARKQEARGLLAGARVSPVGMTALYVLVLLVLDLVSVFSGGRGILSTFVSVLTSLMGTVLGAGFILYCMALRRGERAEYLTLFDGFSFVGRLIGLCLLMDLFIGLWSMLFIVPGIVAAYRYRFAPFNLYENPDVGILGAMEMSRRQTAGYKGQLFLLDLSYLGWTLLASAPSLIQNFLIYREMARVLAIYMQDPSRPLPVLDTASILILPGWAWTLITGVWMLAVAVFFLAQRRCVELSYFETAKATSGVGAGVTPPAPDGLGGL